MNQRLTAGLLGLAFLAGACSSSAETPATSTTTGAVEDNLPRAETTIEATTTTTVATTLPPATAPPLTMAPTVPPTTRTTVPPTTLAPATTAPPATTNSAYYANCSDARAAGAAPLYAGDPGYRSALDRDGDGVACE